MARACVWPSPWRELADKIGSCKAVEYELKVARNTVRFWALDERYPSAMKRAFINLVFEKYGVTKPYGD